MNMDVIARRIVKEYVEEHLDKSDKDIQEMKRIILTDSLTSIEGRYSQLAKRIDDREINIHRMEYIVNELKWESRESKWEK